MRPFLRIHSGYCRVPILILLIASSVPRVTNAGGGPENLLLVVNAQSEASKTIANHYVEWRDIPPCNVVYLDWKRGRENAYSKHFRSEIIQPVLQAIRDRGLGHQIDYIIYSSDFPWRIDFRDDFPGQAASKFSKPLISLTGATYLWRFAIAKSSRMLSLSSNQYVSRRSSPSQDGQSLTPTRGFHSRYQWDRNGTRVATGGNHYVLSTMLGVTQGRGTTVEETLAYLRRSASADGSRPPGTIYFMRNGDVRSRTRHDFFSQTVATLNALGVKAVVESGVLPQGKQDVVGLMVGKARFDLPAAGLKILPGAFCDHLTSFGGVMTKDFSQTPLSAFLRAGAAGSTGTVIEPGAILAKFPHPDVQVHYVRGCSLAEAVYQSVASPMQLLVVGDALCQPWAVSPRVTVDGLAANDVVRGTISVTPDASLPGSDGSIASYTLFVDGCWRQTIQSGEHFAVDTEQLAAGYHELRIVATDNSPIQTQGRIVLPIWVDREDIEFEFQAIPSIVKLTGKVDLRAHCPGASRIVFTQNDRVLGTIEQEEGSLAIEASRLGAGPVALYATAEGTPARARPVMVLID